MKVRYLRFMLVTMTILFTACAKSPAAPAWQEQYDLGMRYLFEENYQEAVVAFTAAIEIDPKQVDAYLGITDAYIAEGNIDAARAILQKGYNETADERLLAKQSELEEGALSSAAAESEELPEKLWVPVRQEGYLEDVRNIYYKADRGPLVVVTCEWDENGYLRRSENRLYYDIDSPQSTIYTYHYDEQAGMWRYTYENKAEGSEGFSGEGEFEKNIRGIGGMSGILNFWMDAYPEGDCPQQVENANPTPSDHDAYPEDWAYAAYEYDEHGNPISVTSYSASGRLLGYATFEWGLLTLGSDGTYHMESF